MLTRKDLNFRWIRKVYAFDPADSTESVIEILDPGTTEAKIGSPVILKDTLAAILKMKGEIDSMGKYRWCKRGWRRPKE